MSETTDIHLSDHLLFIQIRQIFDHMEASENKVSWTAIFEQFILENHLPLLKSQFFFGLPIYMDQDVPIYMGTSICG